jgi:sugar lactone lactonase YvrE
MLAGIKWQEVVSETTGLVDIARFTGWMPGKTDCVFAKAIIHSGKDESKRYRFGYSDVMSIVLNSRVLFTGNSSYRLRDPSFLGIIGMHDSVYLPLKKGENELILMVAESFGGWGFMFQDANAVFLHEDLTALWELPRALQFPESVVYDKKRDVLVVSNFYNTGQEFLSKIKLNGEIETFQWIKGLNRPTGMAITGDTLYVVDRTSLVEIDIAGGKIIKKHPVPGAGFINDVDCDAAGCVYISDSQGHKIYKFSAGQFEVWLQGGEIQAPNGLCVDGEKLLIGTSGDGAVKIANLSDKKITTLARFGSGAVMDGLRMDGKGNYIISDYNGRVFRVTQAGQKTKLLDTTVPQKFCADMEYIAAKNLLIIPTLFDNRVMAFTLK